MNIAKKVTRSSPHHRNHSQNGDISLERDKDDDDDLGRSTDGAFYSPFAKDDDCDDQKDMQRIGKIPQLKRKFRLYSITCFCCMMMGTWEVLLVSNVQGLINGGLAGLFWTYVWTFVGFGFVIASLAEMTSMAPTSGAQYHWVSEFAPRQYQQPLSYIIGWMSTLSWQAGQTGRALFTGTLVHALIHYNQPYWHYAGHYGNICAVVAIVACFVGNVWVSNALPAIQNILMIYHVVGFFLFLFIFSTIAPQRTTREILSEFTNLGEWGSIPMCLLVGQVPAIWAFACSDAASLMSEETHDASINIPKGMWWSYLINGFMGLVFVVYMLRAIPDVSGAVFNNPTPYPFFYIMTVAMPDSYTLTTVFTSIYIVVDVLASIAFNAATSRQTFAFARDHGFPFARWLSKVHAKLFVPVPSITISSLISLLLTVLKFGSKETFDAVISLQLASLMLSHLVSIGCVLHCRLHAPHQLPRARWPLGPRGGVIVNTIAVAYSAFACFWCFWPTSTTRVITDYNWSAVIFCILLGFTLLMYLVQGRWKYKGPVMLVQERRNEYFGPTSAATSATSPPPNHAS